MKTRLPFLPAILTAALLLISCGSKKEIIDLPRADTPESIQQAVDAVLAGDKADDSVLFESLMILKHGKVLYEGWYGDAAPDKPHAMYSVSKSFTATAVGMAVDAGLLKVTDKLVDFFPDKLPEEVSDNLKAVTVRSAAATTGSPASLPILSSISPEHGTATTRSVHTCFPPSSRN